jgi:hypothetical protein
VAPLRLNSAYTSMTCPHRPPAQRAGGPPWRAGAGVGLGLAAGAQQAVVEALVPAPGLRRAVADLLGLQHEGTAPVAVDEPVARRAVTVAEDDAALEHVGVVAGVVACRIRQWHAEQAAQIADEELVVGALAAQRVWKAASWVGEASAGAAAVDMAGISRCVLRVAAVMIKGRKCKTGNPPCKSP